MSYQIKVLVLATITMSLLFWGLTWADESDLVWSTYLGGSIDEWGCAIVLDNSNNCYVTGMTESDDFPTTAGAYDGTFNGNSSWDGGDVFVAKFDPLGSTLLYSTYIGGSAFERCFAIDLDYSGNAYVIGYTGSNDFPTTDGVYNQIFNGGWSDVFMTKLNYLGNDLEYSTYLGGPGDDGGRGITVDGSGNAFVTGYCQDGFPTSVGAFDESHNGDRDVFIAKVNFSGSAFDYATFLGGSGYDLGHDIEIDGSGNAYVTGYTTSPDFYTTPESFDTDFNGGTHDAFSAKLNPTGSDLEYSTFLGGESLDLGRGIVLDSYNNACLIGQTASDDFPTTAGAYDRIKNGDDDAFVAKLNSIGDSLIFSTFLGGDDLENGYGITIDAFSSVYVTGETNSNTFPSTPGAFSETHSGSWDVFMTKLNETGCILEYSTFLGGESADYGRGITLDGYGNVYLIGYCQNGFPTTFGAYDTTHNGYQDAFVSKLSFFEFLPVAFDIKPQSCPNPLNTKSQGVLPVAILGTMDFNVYDVDPASVQLEDVSPLRWNYEDVATPVEPGGDVCDCTDQGPDGFMDLTLKFRTQEIVAALGPVSDGEIKVLTLTGMTQDSTDIEGQDCVVIIHKVHDKKPRPLGMRGGGIMAEFGSYPNPFNAETEIRFGLLEEAEVSLVVYNILGEEVRMLLSEELDAGVHRVHWDGKDKTGNSVASGIYFCRLRTNVDARTMKMIMIR